MTLFRRNFAPRKFALGAILTLIVAGLDWAGQLAPIERWFYDERARHCQRFTPPPSDRLVHIDIDDAALETIGSWPWPRTTLAEIVDELRLAGAEALALDIILAEPQPLGVSRRPDGTLEEVDHDANLAAALKRFGKSMVPVSFTFDPKPALTPRRAALLKVLRADLELSTEEASDKVASQNAPAPANGPATGPTTSPTTNPATAPATRTATETGAAKAERYSEDEFLSARREAMAQRLREAQAGGAHPVAELRALLLPRTHNQPGTSSLLREFETQYRLERSLAEMTRFSVTPPTAAAGEITPKLAGATDVLAMVPQLARAASTSGYVNYFTRPDDPVIRAIPLWVTHEGRLYPQMDLALACALRGIDPHSVRFRPGQVVLRQPDGQDLVIPVREGISDVSGTVDTFLDIPWFGGGDWKTMYDYPAYQRIVRHFPITLPWALADTRKIVARNNAQADKAIGILAEIGVDSAKAFIAKPPAADDIEARIKRMEPIIREASELAGPYLKTPPSELGPDEKVFLDALSAVQRLLRENRAFLDKSAELRATMKGKAIVIGWAATGTVDKYPTPLHSSCPGVVIHGVTFSALMSGHFWHTAPVWVTMLITIGLGLMTTFIAARFSPLRALAATFMLAIAYVAINANLVFDYGDRIVGLAGPVAAIIIVWSGLTLVRLIAEARERARITRRFQSYVDPALVKYVIEHPELARLEGQVREMTVIFTDLAGFTTFAETLREKAVSVLGRYISRMTPVIRRHKGLVHRFMGDGIMFSYGAPIANPEQAADGVATVLEMFDVLEGLNAELITECLPRLNMRAGVCTGTAVVGDSGADDAAEYACLGDTTNTAARLESANKSVGTSKLISARTVELLSGQFLVRPIGRLILVGKTVALMTYEPLAKIADATEAQKELARLTTLMFDHFIAARFTDSIAAANLLDEVAGKSKLSALYREISLEHLAAPPLDFKGHIVLREK